MKAKVITREELKRIFVEILLNKTNKISKVSDHSVTNGVSYGVAAIGQKAMKEIAIAETLINPDLAYGAYLDRLAANWGISPRFGAQGSATYIYVSGDPGTVYSAGSIISGDDGIDFQTEEALTLKDSGFGYISVASTTTGANTNILPLSLTTINPTPVGHIYLTNEYMATGGMNAESDEHFRQRIKEGANAIANGTLSKMEQVLMRNYPRLLKLFHGGVDINGSDILRAATVNGSSFSTLELEAMLPLVGDYLPLADQRIYPGIITYGLSIKNIKYSYIDISFQVRINTAYDVDEVRKQMQINLSKYFDFRYYQNKGIIQWDDLFQIVKNTAGVEYISDQTFTPGADFYIEKDSLPRVRGFLMYNTDGVLISSSGGDQMAIYYPNVQNRATQETI